MRIVFLYVLTCLLLVSCTADTQVAIPDSVLPQDKMVAVMVDVHLLEATMNLNVFNVDRTVAEEPAPGFDVLKKNGITKQQFDESYNFYSQHPALLNDVYEMVLNELSRMQAETINKK